jgi:valyl-tRNA synthetase
VLPWQHAAISGWILDPDRKKMSKSKGNAVTPMDLLREHGTDAVRYWATSARLGVDTAFDLAQIRIGRRLAIKILNAGRFVLGFESPGPVRAAGELAAASGPGAVTEPIDLALLSRLAGVTERCTDALAAYDHGTALEQAERFFWFFCDDYLELVKARAYGEHGAGQGGGASGAASAVATLRLALSVLLRLMAPFLPFVTEEVWSWWQDGSIHRAAWPDPQEFAGAGDDAVVVEAAAGAIAAIRKAKSAARLAMKEPVARLVVTAGQAELDALAAAAADVRAAGRVAEIELRPVAGTAEPEYQVDLA